MKLRCERDILRDALGVVSRAAQSTSAGGAQVLSCVQFVLEGDKLRLTATDRERTVRVEADVLGMGDGSCLLPASLTTDIVRSLDPGAVTVESDEEGARINAGHSQFSVRTYPEEEFPALPVVGGEALSLDGRELAEALRQVVRAAAKGEDRPASLSAVHLQAGERGLRLEATDSYRLAQRDLVGTTVLGEGEQVLVPARAQRGTRGWGEDREAEGGGELRHLRGGLGGAHDPAGEPDLPQHGQPVPPQLPQPPAGGQGPVAGRAEADEVADPGRPLAGGAPVARGPRGPPAELHRH